MRRNLGTAPQQALDACVAGTRVFEHAFDVELDSLVRVGCRFLERDSLAVQARQVSGVHVVATLILRSEHKLDLALTGHTLRIERV